MKKVFVFIITCLFYSILFSEQPFFLRNWIIPDDFEWHANKTIPQIPGKRFYQRMSDNYSNSYISFYDKRKSNIDFPPYFIENNLLDWNKTYAKIIDSFKGNEQFFTYQYVYPSYHKDRLPDSIDFLDIIRIVCRTDNFFELEIYFPHARTQEEREQSYPSYCYIYYQKNGLNFYKLHIPQKEVFESYYRNMWEENSLEEKDIMAFSYYNAKDYNCVPANYDCTLKLDYTTLDAKSVLKSSFDISDRDELLNEVKNYSANSIGNDYEKYLALIDSNPDKEIVTIGIENQFTVTDISNLFFVENMRDAIGKHGIKNFLFAKKLFLLRLGVGAGYITREESVEYGMPFVNQLKKQYASFEDFSTHYTAYFSYRGVKKSKFGAWSSDTIIQYNDASKYIPVTEIQFDGSEADKPLLFDDAYYKPVGEALWWSRIQKESVNLDGKELSTIKYELSKYEGAECLKKLIKQIKPKKYTQSATGKTVQFFKDNYKDVWAKLPETEAYAIAFSSNLFELNRQYHLDFENGVNLSADSADSKELLKDSWSIESRESLIQMFNSLEAYGHSGAYKNLCELLDKYPDKNPIEIASLEKMSLIDTTRLHFVSDTRNITGAHGIEAWDEGREITILRWGISSGYITGEEALKMIEPVVKRIRQNYVSFEDFICHYIMGRQFYALFEGNYKNLGEAAIHASLKARAYIPFDELVFTSENADKDKTLTYTTCLYNPGESFLKWDKIMQLYRQEASLETLEKLEQFENEIPDCKNLFFYRHISLLNHFYKFDDVVSFAEDNMSYLNSLPKDSDAYVNSIYFYISALNNCFNPRKALELYDSLPDNLKNNIYFYYQFAYSNYLMINLSTSQKELEFYRQKAVNSLKILKQYNFNIGDRLENWLQSVEGNM